MKLSPEERKERKRESNKRYLQNRRNRGRREKNMIREDIKIELRNRRKRQKRKEKNTMKGIEVWWRWRESNPLHQIVCNYMILLDIIRLQK